MCALPTRESACWLEGESEEELFKQKYRLENKQRTERAIEKMCACVCARVRACLCVCVCVRARGRRQAAPAAEPKIIRCARERPLPLPVPSAAAVVTRAAPGSSGRRRTPDPAPRSTGLKG